MKIDNDERAQIAAYPPFVQYTQKTAMFKVLQLITRLIPRDLIGSNEEKENSQKV